MVFAITPKIKKHGGCNNNLEKSLSEKLKNTTRINNKESLSGFCPKNNKN
jgi:hypothetical protein